MDLVLTSPLGGSDSQHRPYDGLHMNSEASTQRRHTRYTSPDVSTSQSPRRLNSTATGATPRTSTTADQNHSTISHAPSNPPSFLVASVAAAPQSSSADVPLEINGQNHDRMEMDVDNREITAVDQPPDVGPDSEEALSTSSGQDPDGDVMDTAPDTSLAIDASPASNLEMSTGLPSPSPGQDEVSPPSWDTVEVRVLRASDPWLTPNHSGDLVGIDPVTLQDVQVTRDGSDESPPSHIHEAPSVVSPAAPEANQPDTSTAPLVDMASNPPPILEGIAPPGPNDSHSRANAEGEQEEDSQDDGSTDEEDYPFWTNFKEDTSSPDAEELKVIETMREVNALDHQHWEESTYKPLDDPEYIPSVAGRITWTVKGVRGTPEKPNREPIMTSPSVLIGDHYWNIKFYPRGNEGTEQISVYIECSDSPNEAKEIRTVTAASLATHVGEEVSTEIPRESHSGGSSADPSTAVIPEPQSPQTSTETIQPSLPPPVEKRTQDEAPWEVAAQVCCVMYNPEEPRVFAVQKSTHRYCNENSDWGWTRFHGPWNEMHKRERYKRQALLRNDTLAFTAYIRPVKDDTRALWWHPPKDRPEWNSLARIGLRRLVNESLQSGSLIAALSTWLHLTPIRDVIHQIPLSSLNLECKILQRPLAVALKTLIQDMQRPQENFSPSSSFKVSLRSVVDALRWYGEDQLNSGPDVIATWEMFQRILNYEGSTVKEVADASNLFQTVYYIKQSELSEEGKPRLNDTFTQLCPAVEPHSVQDTVDLALKSNFKASKQWHDLHESVGRYPSVLHVELHRQKYSKEARRWKKLTHQIKMDETISIETSFSSPGAVEYTLYGMIVHSGDLESNDYFSVVRPAGPGTPWVKYAGDKDSKGVCRLTKKQALEDHEGKGRNTKSTNPVAYITTYVRTDCLFEVLSRPVGEISLPTSILEPSKKLAQSGDPTSTSESVDRMISLRILEAESFRNYSGRGIFDLSSCETSSQALLAAGNIEFPASKTLRDVERYAVQHAAKADKRVRFRLWVLDPRPHKSVRYLPRFSSSFRDGTLDEVVRRFGCCIIWLQSLSSDVDETTLPESPLRESVNTSNTENMELVEFPSHNRTDEVMEEPPSQVPAEVVALIDDPSNFTSETTHGQERADSQDAEGLEALNRTTSEGPISSQAEQNHHDEDTVMESTGESAISQAQDLPVSLEGSQNWALGSDKSLKAYYTWQYFLLKVFDADAQTLRGLGGYFIKKVEKIEDAIKRLLSPAPGTAYDIYHESSLALDRKDRVDAHISFSGAESALYPDGSVFIIQPRPSDTLTAKLEAEGKPKNPIEYFAWLRHLDDPSLVHEHRLLSYFGSAYAFTTQKYGRPHGSGTLITMTGDAYSGDFVSGSKCGNGIMEYANGDNYTGQWGANEPNGQGRMVYAKTGNVYIGGFKKRKRHGKGLMRFEVADEEMQLCRICYEEEMDALFYDCGHVAACEECARQVEACPVCRKGVRAVVKIWRT